MVMLYSIRGDVMDARKIAILLANGGTVDRKDVNDIKLVLLNLKDIQSNCRSAIKQLKQAIGSEDIAILKDRHVTKT